MNQQEPLNPKRTASQIAALTEHLQRSGIRYLPHADRQNVGNWRRRFSQPAAASPVSQPRTAEATDVALADQVAPDTNSQPAGLTQSATAPSAYASAGLPIAERQQQLDLLAQQVASCTRCQELVQCRTHTVFGEGNPAPRIVFFGEGPGVDEDRSGRPFVGKAGQLLTKMIEACSFSREEVYILNTVKCRPPGNRNPESDEVQQCREFFERQLSILQPEYIVCLGAVASRALLQSSLSVGRLRGKLHRYCDSKVLVTYHPAYLLRTPAAKKAAWDDLQLMLRDAGVDPRSGRRS